MINLIEYLPSGRFCEISRKFGSPYDGMTVERGSLLRLAKQEKGTHQRIRSSSIMALTQDGGRHAAHCQLHMAQRYFALRGIGDVLDLANDATLVAAGWVAVGLPCELSTMEPL